MKKYLYTLSLVALFAAVGTAQSAEPAKKQNASKQAAVNDDGTTATKPATEAQQNPKTDNAQPAGASDKPAPAKRMAITEKGVPASKSTDGKKATAAEPKRAEPAKTEKH
jgi:hypothetical protein